MSAYKPKKDQFSWAVDFDTRTGQVRDENQDAVITSKLKGDEIAMIVCDGAGGVPGGRAAARSAARAIENSLRQNIGKPEEAAIQIHQRRASCSLLKSSSKA